LHCSRSGLVGETIVKHSAAKEAVPVVASPIIA
jgi:hypothetical protein